MTQNVKKKKKKKPYDHLLFNQLGHGAFETNSYTTFGKKNSLLSEIS